MAQQSQQSTHEDFVPALATGWPENQPDIMILSLTTKKGMQDFALNKEQALLIAKTMKETAAQLEKQKPQSGGSRRRSPRRRALWTYERDNEIDAPRNWLSAL